MSNSEIVLTAYLFTHIEYIMKCNVGMEEMSYMQILVLEEK